MTSTIDNYLTRRAATGPWHLTWPGDADVNHVVVIPALAESGSLFDTLSDLRAAAANTRAMTLVIVVVNNRAAGHAPDAWLADNQATLSRLRPLVEESHRWPQLRLGIIDAASTGLELSPRDGVGMARKVGLDAALRVLHDAGRPHAGLISLDADTRVDVDYLHALHAFFDATPRWGVVVPFRHPLPEAPAARAAILRYELHLLLYALGLHRAGSPYGFTAVGSAMACTPAAYAAVSGMRRSQAGEDFYFLQQLAKTGPIAWCSETTVRPAPRVSMRVPFGTGRAMATPEAGPCAETYNPEIYAVLGDWLGRFDPARSGGELRALAAPLLNEILRAQDFDTAWARIQANSRGVGQATAQFHRWFDGFRTLKAIHFLRDGAYPNVPVEVAARTLLPDLPAEASLVELRDAAQAALAGVP